MNSCWRGSNWARCYSLLWSTWCSRRLSYVLHSWIYNGKKPSNTKTIHLYFLYRIIDQEVPWWFCNGSTRSERWPIDLFFYSIVLNKLYRTLCFGQRIIWIFILDSQIPVEPIHPVHPAETKTHVDIGKYLLVKLIEPFSQEPSLGRCCCGCPWRCVCCANCCCRGWSASIGH